MKIFNSIKRLFSTKNKIDPAESFDSKLCVICYEKYVSKPIDCCKQSVCSDCLSNTIERDSRCPCCRQELHIDDADAEITCNKNDAALKLIAFFSWVGVVIFIFIIWII